MQKPNLDEIKDKNPQLGDDINAYLDWLETVPRRPTGYRLAMPGKGKHWGGEVLITPRKPRNEARET